MPRDCHALDWGTAGDRTVERLDIASADGMRAAVIGYGAALQDLTVPVGGTERRVVLGFERLDDYLAHSPHFGAVPGRFANRIANGRFVLDGLPVRLDRNQGGVHHIHGGTSGFGKRAWTLVDACARSATFALVSQAGEMGYPGRLVATATLALAVPTTLRVELTATTDAPTVVNLTHHSYFNLADAGAGSVLDHQLEVAAPAYLPVDADGIPSGAVLPVEGTPFDFRRLRRLRRADSDGTPVRTDHCFVLGRARSAGGLAFAARLSSPAGDLALEVWTTEPGVQVYDGAKLALPVPGLGGVRYGAFSGLCLEAQRFPDTPNHPQFGSAVLRPGELYRQVTEYRFRAG